MRNVSTFGFRGEALASISFVSKMMVKTKKKENEFGVQGHFENGRLKFQEGQEELEIIFKADGTDILVNEKIIELFRLHLSSFIGQRPFL